MKTRNISLLVFFFILSIFFVVPSSVRAADNIYCPTDGVTPTEILVYFHGFLDIGNYNYDESVRKFESEMQQIQRKRPGVIGVHVKDYFKDIPRNKGGGWNSPSISLIVFNAKAFCRTLNDLPVTLAGHSGGGSPIKNNFSYGAAKSIFLDAVYWDPPNNIKDQCYKINIVDGKTTAVKTESLVKICDRVQGFIYKKNNDKGTTEEHFATREYLSKFYLSSCPTITNKKWLTSSNNSITPTPTPIPINNFITPTSCAVVPIEPDSPEIIEEVPTSTDTTYTPLVSLPGLDGDAFDTKEPCAFGTYLNIMIKLIIGIAAVLAMIMIIMGGIEYMTSELVSGKESGKETIQHAILGLVIALGAYLILNTINPQLLNVCLDNFPEATITIKLEELPNGSYSSTGGAGAGSSGGGSCTVETNPSNPCHPTQLNSCFKNRADDASKICKRESQGIADIESRSDLLNMGKGPAYSVGLWQINLTYNQVGNLDCPRAFSEPCGVGTVTQNSKGPYVGGPKIGNCRAIVRDEKLYTQCVQAAKDPVKNTAAACKLYQFRNSFQPWAGTANACGISTK